MRERQPLGVQPTYSIVDPNRNRLYVTNSGDNTVSVFDVSSVTQGGSDPAVPTLATVPVGTDPVGVIPLLDGTNFYVANAGSNNVTVVSQSSFTTQATVTLPTGANPVWIAADPTSQKVYVADSGNVGDHDHSDVEQHHHPEYSGSDAGFRLHQLLRRCKRRS